MTLFHLLRHAAHDRVDAVLCGRMAGVSLGAAGLAQAERLGARMAREKLTALYTSPMERCRQTAFAVGAASGVVPRVDDGLNEIDFGAWSGCRFDALADDPRWHRWNAARDVAATPGGETMAAVQTRAVSALAAMARRHGEAVVAVISHADVIKAILMHVLGLSLAGYDRFDIAPASISTVVTWEGGAKVLAMNETIG